MSVICYGELNSEKIAKENLIARQIVAEINKFGINDRQRWMIMYLMGLELEKIDEMRCVTEFVRTNKNDELFVANLSEESGER